MHTVVKKADKTADSYAELQLGVISVDEYDQAMFRCSGEYGTEKNPKTAHTDLILDIQRKRNSMFAAAQAREEPVHAISWYPRVQMELATNNAKPIYLA